MTADDLYVDSRFGADEKTVVETDPCVVRTPTDTKNLLAVLRRNYRGGVEQKGECSPSGVVVGTSSRKTAVEVLRTASDPLSAIDAAVYLAMALAARWPRRVGQRWERDRSTRLPA